MGELAQQVSHRAPAEVPMQQLDPGLAAPAYARESDAGADLRTTQDVRLAPGQRTLVPTGVALAIPEGYAGFIHPRSGLAVKHGLSVVNAPGTIDAGYRGEIKVALINLDPDETIVLRRGDRIAQLVIQQVAHARFLPVQSLEGSERGASGFGSTGGFGEEQQESADLRESEHMECDCVPTLGPSHCHLCGEASGAPVSWPCPGEVPA